MSARKDGPLRVGGTGSPYESHIKSWESMYSSLLLSRPPWLAVYQDKVRLPAGTILNDFYRVVLPDFVCVAAVTPAQELVLVHCYKHGLGRVSLCVPAGILEAGECPLEGARRELLEETGYQAADWQCLGSFLTDGNRHCGTGHFFLARRAVQVAEGNVGDEKEEVEVQLVKPGRFFWAVREGAIALLPTVTTITLALATGLITDTYVDLNGVDDTPLVQLTDASKVNVNLSLGNDFILAMTSAVGSSRAMTFANSSPGQSFSIKFQQPASEGPCTPSFSGVTVTWQGGSAPTFSRMASAIDKVGFDVLDSTPTFYGWLC